MKELLGKSHDDIPLPIRSKDLQLVIEFFEKFLLKVKGISEVFGNIPPSESRLIPDFPISPLTNFVETKQEDCICNERTVHK